MIHPCWGNTRVWFVSCIGKKHSNFEGSLFYPFSVLSTQISSPLLSLFPLPFPRWKKRFNCGIDTCPLHVRFFIAWQILPSFHSPLLAHLQFPVAVGRKVDWGFFYWAHSFGDAKWRLSDESQSQAHIREKFHECHSCRGNCRKKIYSSFLTSEFQS